MGMSILLCSDQGSVTANQAARCILLATSEKSGSLLVRTWTTDCLISRERDSKLPETLGNDLAICLLS